MKITLTAASTDDDIQRHDEEQLKVRSCINLSSRAVKIFKFFLLFTHFHLIIITTTLHGLFSALSFSEFLIEILMPMAKLFL